MILIEPSGEGCQFYTQGPEAQIRRFSDRLNIEEAKNGMIPASKIFEISRNIPEDSNISMHFDENTIKVSSEGCKYTLKGLPAEDFPKMDEPQQQETTEIAERDLKHVFEKTDFSIAVNDPRHYLNGLFFALQDDRLSAVSTDSHRLALSSLPVSNDHKSEGIIPRDVVIEIKRLLTDSKAPAQISITPKRIIVSLAEMQISAKCINGPFPDYTKAVPKEFSTEITLERASLLQSLQRAAAISVRAAADESPYAGLVFSSGELLVKSKNPDGEEANIKQKIEYDGEEQEINFNSSYLQDVLKALDTPTVCLHIRDANSGIKITGTGSTTEEYIVMPLRI